MDYVPGSIAALISGNVTPNGHKITKRAFTPIKHQPSPNVTPKSESVIDRSIFLSPTMQKKKAIIKKSPKRIFQNQDFDITNDDDTSLPTKISDVDKAKKRLKNDLEVETSNSKGAEDKNSSKKQQFKSGESPPPKKKTKKNTNEGVNAQVDNETTPENKKRNFVLENTLKKCEDKENADFETMLSLNVENQSPKKKNNKLKSMSATIVNARTKTQEDNETVTENMNIQNGNKSRKRKISKSESIKNVKINAEQNSAQVNNSIIAQPETESASKKSKKRNKRNKKSKQNNQPELNINQENDNNSDSIENSTQNLIKAKCEMENEKLNAEQNSAEATNFIVTQSETESAPKKSKKKNKQKTKSIQNNQTELNINQENDNNESIENSTQNGIKIKSKKGKKKNKNTKSYVNPNAITDKDTDSEHESDNEIESENEEINKKILETGSAEESSDEEEDIKKPEKEEKESVKPTNDEIKRTIFVGNILFSKKCKKEMKKIFSKHGTIETIRIRTIPVKDARVTPKLAVIKNELHPDRSTVNAYIKYADVSSVEKALVENNTILNELHLRVSRSDHAGEDHDPRCSIFVGNIPFGLEDEALRDKFENCGEIESVRIIRDRKTNAGKGFGYVNFASKDGVELALAMTEEDLTIKNRILRVKRCTQMTKKSGTNTQKTGNNLPNRKQGGNNFVNRNHGSNNSANRNQGGNNFHKNFSRGKNFGDRQGNVESKSDGAYRRIMNKRGNQDAGEGPPNKRPRNINQPKEKKVRKEYVGLTAEKKKKQKYPKGQKKKKALSEILTKKT